MPTAAVLVVEVLDDVPVGDASVTATRIAYRPAAAKRCRPMTSNWPSEPVTIPRLVGPFPHRIVATKLPVIASRFVSVNVATTPLKTCFRATVITIGWIERPSTVGVVVPDPDPDPVPVVVPVLNCTGAVVLKAE